MCFSLRKTPFLEQLFRATLASCWAMLTQMYSYASAVLLSPIRCAFAVGDSIPFLGFEYMVMITLASHVFEYFLRFLLQACVICAFWLRWGVTWCDTPYFLAYPHVFLTCGPFLGFLGFFGFGQSYSCVGVDRHDDYSADSSASLAQCGFVGGFIPNFAIFALVSDHLRNFCFYSWDSLWPVQIDLFANSACLFFSLSLLW